MNVRKIIITTLALCLIGCASGKNQQVQKEKSIIESVILDIKNDELFVGINNNDLHYIFRCKSKEPQWKDNGNTYLFLLDNDTMLKVLNFNFHLKSNLYESDILQDNMKYELNYREEIMNKKIKTKNEVVQLKNRKALYWSLELPENEGGTQYYLSLIVKNKYLIGFNSPKTNKPENFYKKLLIDIANTLEIIDTPITDELMFKYPNIK